MMKALLVAGGLAAASLAGLSTAATAAPHVSVTIGGPARVCHSVYKVKRVWWHHHWVYKKVKVGVECRPRYHRPYHHF